MGLTVQLGLFVFVGLVIHHWVSLLEEVIQMCFSFLIFFPHSTGSTFIHTFFHLNVILFVCDNVLIVSLFLYFSISIFLNSHVPISITYSLTNHHKGWEHGTGIFISEVHPGSEAQLEGLKVNLEEKEREKKIKCSIRLREILIPDYKKKRHFVIL